MKEITRDMIIEYKQLTLLQKIGQGKPEILQANRLFQHSCPFQGEFGIVYKATLAALSKRSSTTVTIVAVKMLKGNS